MASSLRLFVRGASASAGRRAWARVRAEFAATTAALSRHDPASELVAFDRRAATRSAGLVVASWRLRTALAAADRARRLTDGRFEPRVLGDLLRLGDGGLAFPLEPGPSRPIGRLVELHRGGGARLERPVDLGGIGKGLALRWAAAAAREGLPPDAGFLLDAGGDMVCVGLPPSAGWSVGIEDPAGSATPVAVVALTQGALATSSVALRHWRDTTGREVHHLIDPRTGEPGGEGLRAVTVAGPDPAWAEVWSKALFLAGVRAIGDEARAQGLTAWWVEEGGDIRMTPAARQTTTWLRGEGSIAPGEEWSGL